MINIKSLQQIFHSKIQGYKVFGIFLICYSLVFIPYGSYKAIDRFVFLQRAIKIEGQIIDFVSRKNGRGRGGIITYSPIVQFMDSAGKLKTYLPGQSFSASYIKQRKTFPIYVTYEPKYEVYLDDFFEIWGVICFTMGVSFASLLLGIYLLKYENPSLHFD